MTRDELISRVREIIEPVIRVLGVEIDDIELNRMRGRGLLRVYIDKEDGVTIDDCEQVSREIEALLDVEDPIPYSYVLEVSSPGLDRPLRGPKDFMKYSGKVARVVTHEPVDKQTFFVGSIAGADDSEVVLLLPRNKTVKILYLNISKARLEVEI